MADLGAHDGRNTQLRTNQERQREIWSRRLEEGGRFETSDILEFLGETETHVVNANIELDELLGSPMTDARREAWRRRCAKRTRAWKKLADFDPRLLLQGVRPSMPVTPGRRESDPTAPESLILRRAVSHLTIPEMATVLGVSISAVKSRLSRLGLVKRNKVASSTAGDPMASDG